MDQGTGFVHIAPGHGADDFELGRAQGLEIPHTVDGDGVFLPHVPLVRRPAGLYRRRARRVTANAAKIMAALDAAGTLLAKGKLRHSYPHSWRSKAPLIFRNTPQWFISMETNGLRAARRSRRSTRPASCRPPAGPPQAMIEQRPDWCVSRQRVWGVPLPIFVHKESGEVLRDQAVIDRVAEAFEDEGGDAWFTSDPQALPGQRLRDAADYEQITDVVEVWFDSGSTHAYVLEARPELAWPASLYLEGSDQHRGWFHTSLLESVGTRGRAPFDAVLTHGFVLDEKAARCPSRWATWSRPRTYHREAAAPTSCASGWSPRTMPRTSASAPRSCATRSTPIGACATPCAT